jgi:RHH-type proline utilization regulon transcriptional repressor/proline dehydrogenase/delta 1-pyrroline-5-carboxylate dehydrogenase
MQDSVNTSGPASRYTEIKARLAEPDPDLYPDAPLHARQAIELARMLQRRAMQLQTAPERRQQDELERMMQSPHDKATLTQMTDQTLRSSTSRRAVNQLLHILDVQGIPRFFSGLDRALLKGFQSFGAWLPGVAVPMVQERMRRESANVILPAEEEILIQHLRERQGSGVRMNVNFLGEALLGEEAAAERMNTYLSALQKPDLECLSIKISTIYSQISSLAWEDTVNVLCDRLELIYREAARMRYRRNDGTEVPKFVYLDMEEYRDMSVTAEAFMRTLDRPGMQQVRAGIALQAYLPDAWDMQKRINAWARQRVAAGGAPVTVRLVKGANLEMEKVDASIHGWPQAPYTSKAQVDANYKRMLGEALVPENIAAVHLGIASHNLFDLSYGLVLAAAIAAEDKVQFEMLEGMANHQRRALFEVASNLLLYAPATRREQFIHAIGYLVRRLDENTGPDNFLAHAFKIEVGSEQWAKLEQQFLTSFELIETLPSSPRRTQNRCTEVYAPEGLPGAALTDFVNEPDTDFALAQNLEWVRELMSRWEGYCDDAAMEIPLVVAGDEVLDGRTVRQCIDPSRPQVTVGRYREANEDDLVRAVACAESDVAGWGKMADRDRYSVLGRVAAQLRQARGDLIAVAMLDGGKTVIESDPEVSEAIDFVEYYRRSALELQENAALQARPKGIVAVVPPWNFPIAIPCGGIAAALAAGNRVILKPASQTVMVAYELCKSFWRAGVPREALQFMPCQGSGVGSKLVADPRVNAVILTGGTDTALSMLESRPDINLLAETGGKDATIVTAMADRDQAIKNVMHSAFGHSGQKCSATSLLILEQEVYDDPGFKKALCDAVSSLHVGSARDLATRVGPLVVPPSGALERGLKELEPGESWAVAPRCVGDNPRLYSPAVKWGVTPGNFTHMTELFGPVLAVMRARDLDHAIDLVNQTGYGLTSGIESLDVREQGYWRKRIRAGNLYINRVTTGAVVLRQPFGGMGKSAFGPGIKAGGPNYVVQLMDFSETGQDKSSVPGPSSCFARLVASIGEAADDGPVGSQLLRALASYEEAWDREFSREHDHFKLLGQHNIRRYLPVGKLAIRVGERADVFRVIAAMAAAWITGNEVLLSLHPELSTPVESLLEKCAKSFRGRITLVRHTEQELVHLAHDQAMGRLRMVGAVASNALLLAAARNYVYVVRAPVLASGRVELLWYLKEQSISDNYHRYGNLGEHGAEGRARVL